MEKNCKYHTTISHSKACEKILLGFCWENQCDANCRLTYKVISYLHHKIKTHTNTTEKKDILQNKSAANTKYKW